MGRWAERLAGMAVAMACLLAPAHAQAPPPDPALEAYVDGLVDASMRDHHIAGAGVVVVRDGVVVLKKGYGQADRTGRPVDPDRTLFRIASISKTFTWIALMQLVEQGVVNLEKPANDYLPPSLRIPADGFAAPVLVRHLLTHSAGFEDLVAGHLFIADPALALPLNDALVRYRPKRVRAPGEAIVYSNYGTALAGALIQHVTGERFEDRIERTIFTPLGLQNTTFREPYGAELVAHRGLPSPMSPALAADLAEGLDWREGAWRRRPFEHVVQFAPAGSVSTTPADMGRYLVALAGGLDGVVRPETAALFAGPGALAANAPGVNGVAHGMLQFHSPGGWRGWGHGGDTIFFHSELALFPDLSLGVFVTTNSETGPALRDLLPGAIADRIGGVRAIATAAQPETAPLRRFAGAYLVDRRAYSTIERSFCLVGCTVTARLSEDGRLVLGEGAESVTLEPLGAEKAGGATFHRFRNARTGEIAAFEERDGRIVRYISAAGINRATRASAFDLPEGFAAVLLIGLLGAAAAVASGVARIFAPAQPGAAARFAGLAVPGAGTAWLGAMGLYGAYFATASSDTWTVFADWPGVMKPAAFVTAAAGVLSAVALAAVALAWGRANWSVWRRARIAATLACFAGLALILWRWNMLWPDF